MGTRLDMIGLFVNDPQGMVASHRDVPGFEPAWDGHGPYAEFKHEGIHFSMTAGIQSSMIDLNSPVDSVRLSAVKHLGKSGHPSPEILQALQKIKKNDKNKFVRYAAKTAIKKLGEILELTGTDRPLSELSERELLERLLMLQFENKRSMSSVQSLLSFLLNIFLLSLFLYSMLSH